MTVRGWILIQAEAGRARAICDGIAAYRHPGVRILTADTVTGPYDVIAYLEADDLDALTTASEVAAEGASGVEHVTTCLTVH